MASEPETSTTTTANKVKRLTGRLTASERFRDDGEAFPRGRAAVIQNLQHGNEEGETKALAQSRRHGHRQRRPSSRQPAQGGEEARKRLIPRRHRLSTLKVFSL